MLEDFCLRGLLQGFGELPNHKGGQHKEGKSAREKSALGLGRL